MSTPRFAIDTVADGEEVAVLGRSDGVGLFGRSLEVDLCSDGSVGVKGSEEEAVGHLG